MTQKNYAGNRAQKLVYSTLSTTARMVAHIIVDSRTLNQTVVAYDGETSISETWKIAKKVIGEDFSDYPRLAWIDCCIHHTLTRVKLKSLFVRGNTTVARAKASGCLDSRRLYDGMPYPNVEEEEKTYYASGFVLDYGPEEVLSDGFKAATSEVVHSALMSQFAMLYLQVVSFIYTQVIYKS
ncbi:hypothetical protein PTI98_012430 [Pleurotus ostreatus]|nr:hypothetical protein PTI98_012430 [Pleurotus ostreatus]